MKTSGMVFTNHSGLIPRTPFEHLRWNRCGILIGSGMGGLTVFQNNVEALVTKVLISLWAG